MPVEIGEEFTKIFNDGTSFTGKVTRIFIRDGKDWFEMWDGEKVYVGEVPIIQNKKLPPFNSSKF